MALKRGWYFLKGVSGGLLYSPISFNPSYFSFGLMLYKYIYSKREEERIRIREKLGNDKLANNWELGIRTYVNVNTI
jgi:hypothetical protein